MATDKPSKPIQLVHQINDYVQLVASTPCVVKFTADWCGPCKRMAPTYEHLARTYSQKIQFLEVDVDKSPMLATQVQAIPLFIFYLSGDVVPELTVRGGSIQSLNDNMLKFVSSLEKLVIPKTTPPLILERLADDDVEDSDSDFEDYPDPDDELPQESQEPQELEGLEELNEAINDEPIIEKTISEDLINPSQ